MESRETSHPVSVLTPELRVHVSPPIWILLALFGVAVVLLFKSPLREFADESDNLLGGYLLVRGYRLYADYFSSHMPFVYYLAAIPSLLGASKLEHYRLFSNALLVLTTLSIVWGFRRRLPLPVLLLWAIMAVFAHRLSWGEMLHAGTCAGYGVLVAGLLFYTTPDLAFSLRQKLALSVAVFVAVQSSLLTIYPLALLAVCYVAVRLAAARHTSIVREARAVGSLLLIVATPHLVVLALYWSIGALGPFIYDAYLFNQRYYSQFVMNPSVLGMLHDWQAQYRTYLYMNLFQPFGIEWFLILANFVATLITFRARGALYAGVFYLFIGLTRLRAEGSYYLTSYFSVAIAVVWAASAFSSRVRAWRERRAIPRLSPSLLGAAGCIMFLALTLNFFTRVALTYNFSGRPHYRSPFAPIVQTATSRDERLFVAPYDPYLYLATERLPATKYPFYFPWQAADPATEADLLGELSASRPPLVVFQRYELVNGQYLTIEWGKRVFEYLQQEYVQVDPSHPVLGDVFMRPDRVGDVRKKLEEAGLYSRPSAT